MPHDDDGDDDDYYDMYNDDNISFQTLTYLLLQFIIYFTFARLLCIRDFSVSNISPDVGYHVRFFRGFFNPSRNISIRNIKLGHDRFLPHPFQFIIRSFDSMEPVVLSY
jgi:hypothetical protein